MNFGKNLQNLRKAQNLSQEELADKLNVSRQAISKWESGTGLPEMDKLLVLCEMFDCKLDDLVRGECNRDTQNNENLKTFYTKLMNKFSFWVSFAIALILFGTVPLLGLADFGAPWVDYGLVVLLIFVAIAVPIFVMQGIRVGNFKLKHPKLDVHYSEAEIDNFNTKFTMMTAGAVGVILIGLVVFMALMVSNVFGTESSRPVAVFMLFIAFGAPIFVYAGIQKSKYDIAHYNYENSPEFIKKSRNIGVISGVIMMIATILFLFAGFIYDMWDTAWAVYPIAGILCGIVGAIVRRDE